MSHTNELPTVTDNDASACSTGCCKMCPGTWRAVVMLPAMVLLGGMAAVTMFPELADYGYPLFGRPSHTGFTGAGPCPGGLCPSPLATARSVDAVKPASSEDATIPNCCAEPTSRARSFCCPVSPGEATADPLTKDQDRTLTDSTTSGEQSDQPHLQDESPADAITVLSAVQAEAQSN